MTLYATINGTEPSKSNFAFQGPPPLEFLLSKTASVKVVAVNDLVGASTAEQRGFVKHNPAGVGMLLEKVRGLSGVYVQEVLEGGAVWKHGVIQAGDEIKMIDSTIIGAMELNEVTKRILGQAGSKIRLKVLREDRNEEGVVVDDVGQQFWVTIDRGPIDKNYNAAMRHPPVPINTLEGYQRVELTAEEKNSVVNRHGHHHPANNSSRPVTPGAPGF